MDRLEPIGGHIDDLRATIGATAIINTMRRMFGEKDAELLDPRDLIPWREREPEIILHDPSQPGYDAEAHAEALKKLFMRHSPRSETLQ